MDEVGSGREERNFNDNMNESTLVELQEEGEKYEDGEQTIGRNMDEKIATGMIDGEECMVRNVNCT